MGAFAAQEKQARLLAQQSGHFSMIRYATHTELEGSAANLVCRALHLADLITELNGMHCSLDGRATSNIFQASAASCQYFLP